MKTFDKMARQGDVVLKRIAKLPDGLVAMKREGKRVVLAHGEVTGHAHAIGEKHVRQFRAADGTPTLDGAGVKLRAGGALPARTYIEVTKTCLLQHEEHEAIQIAPGFYEVNRQREYVEGQIRNVAD
jgi:hypothetical protein